MKSARFWHSCYMSRQLGIEFSGENASLLVENQLEQLVLKDENLVNCRMVDKEKVELVRWLLLETTTTLKWIANRLQMGSWTYVSNMLNRKE
jgi:hypothetical protein